MILILVLVGLFLFSSLLVWLFWLIGVGYFLFSSFFFLVSSYYFLVYCLLFVGHFFVLDACITNLKQEIFLNNRVPCEIKG